MIKIKLNNKKEKLILFLALFFVILGFDLVFYSKFLYNERSYYIESYCEGNEKCELDGKIEIEQTFTANSNNLEVIVIGFSKDFRTYSHDPIAIQIIRQDSGEVIAEYDSIYQMPVQNYKKYKFKLKEQNDSEGKWYKIRITYENGSRGNPVLYQNKEGLIQGELTINGEKQYGNLNFELYYNNKYANTIFTIAIIGFNVSTIIFLVFFILKKISLERTFLIVTIVLGLLYVFAIPIYRGDDEHAHFYRAYEISQGIFNTRIVDNESVTEIPKAFEETTPDGVECNRTYYREVINFLNTSIKNEENIYVNGSYMAVYSPIQYIPQVIVIKALSVFTKNVSIIFYSARIANLLIAISLLYFAIKLIPVGKKIIFLITLIPIAMVQIATVSPDALILASSTLFISYILKLWYEKRNITITEVVKLSIMGSIIALCKIVYIPFVFMVLIISKNQFKDKKSYFIGLILMILVPLLLNLIWLNIADQHLNLIDNNKADEQVFNILTNIPEYLRIIFYTIEHNINSTVTELFGGGYITHNEDFIGNGYITVIPIIVLFLLEILLDKEINMNLKMNIKLIMIVVILVIIALILTSLYVQWSPLKWYYIDGIQGRYFLPLLLLISILLGQNNLVKENRKVNLQLAITIVSILLNMIILMEIVIKYI